MRSSDIVSRAMSDTDGELEADPRRGYAANVALVVIRIAAALLDAPFLSLLKSAFVSCTCPQPLALTHQSMCIV